MGCVDKKLMGELKRLLGRKDIGDDPEKWDSVVDSIKVGGLDLEIHGAVLQHGVASGSKRI